MDAAFGIIFMLGVATTIISIVITMGADRITTELERVADALEKQNEGERP